MGLSWQQGPLAPGAIGRFLVPDPLPEPLLYEVSLDTPGYGWKRARAWSRTASTAA